MTTQATTTDPHLDALLALIHKTWGYSTLRPLQQPAMQAMLDRRDSLVVLPTGGGKSLCYQAPALYLSHIGEGPTVIISPLIALMKDQVDSLRSLGIAAAQLDSSLSPDERRQVAADLRAGSLHMLYLSPERLVNGGESLHAMLRDAGVRTFAIDEAHCISSWGHDFRPEYRQLANLKQMFPGAAVHAFTATATEPVRRDIASQLALEDPELLVGNFDRPNLTYRILPRRDLYAQIAEVLARHKDEAGIIYCLRRKDVDEITATLSANKSLGRKAIGYHAGMTPEQRRAAQEAFIEEEADLIVATIAFGMGIDRSNIRFVLHAGMPKSIEAYQQETGRAGRDGLEAECILLYSAQDVMTWKFIIEKSAQEARNAGTALAPDFIPTAMKHIDDMDRFARGAMCRHKALVEHFGQRYKAPEGVQGFKGSRVQGDEDSETLEPLNPEPLNPSAGGGVGCGACDHCLGDTTAVPDATTIAQKILSAIARTDQRFGVGHILAILRGAKTDRIRQFNHDKLPTYGLLRDYPEAEIRDFVYQLIGQNALAQENLALQDGRSVPILKLNKTSIAVLKGQQQVRLVQIVRKSASEARKTRGEENSWNGVDHELFDALRGLRKQIAGERNVPPYVIFSDATLRELAKVRPTTMQNFRLVYGIGENKLNDLGPKVIPFISAHCEAKGLSTDHTHLPPSTPPTRPAVVAPSASSNSQKAQAFQMFRQGAAIEEVAQQIGRARSTVSEYLAEFITLDRPATIGPWVADSVYKQVVDVQRQLATDRLKPIFLALNEQVPYDHIRLVIAHLATR
jgi:ATP-dependent DNA helicase RecQ